MPTDPKPAAADLTADELTKLKRDELDKVAADAGVANPDALPNKDAVIDAMPNPALAPVPEPEPGELTYEVIGPHRVHDTPTGGTFTADLKAEHEALLIESGHIKRTTPQED